LGIRTPKLNLPDNFWYRAPNTKVGWNPLSTVMKHTDGQTHRPYLLCVRLMDFLQVTHKSTHCWQNAFYDFI